MRLDKDVAEGRAVQVEQRERRAEHRLVLALRLLLGRLRALRGAGRLLGAPIVLGCAAALGVLLLVLALGLGRRRELRLQRLVFRAAFLDSGQRRLDGCSQRALGGLQLSDGRVDRGLVGARRLEIAHGLACLRCCRLEHIHVVDVEPISEPKSGWTRVG